MVRYIIVSFLPDNLNKVIEPVRDHFERGVNAIIAPHVSLTYPFWLNVHEEEIKRELLAAASQLKPFSTTITGVSTFAKNNGRVVIYAAVLGEELWQKTNEVLQKGIEKMVKFDTREFPQGVLPSYIPHITLIMNGDQKEVNEAKNMISSAIVKSFMVEKFWMLKKEDKAEKWEKVSEFTF